MHTRLNDNIKLEDIFIGCSDGELEANKENFLDLFYVGNNKYQTIMSNKTKFIISGRKGSGKTILAKYIEKKEIENNNICKICKMGDFNIRCLIDLESDDPSFKELNHFWKWTILIGITELLLKNPPKIYEVKKMNKYRKLKKFYTSIYPNPKNNNGYILDGIEKSNSSKIKAGLKKKLPNYDLGSDAEKAYTIKTSYKKAKYYHSLDQLSLLIDSYLSNYNLTLIYDDLDGVEDTIQNAPLYRNILISLINVIKDVNIQYQHSNINCRLMVVIRDDILETLHSYNSNLSKITSDCEVQLYWADIPDYKNPEKHPLMDLILTKVQKSVPYFSNMSKKDLYKRLFPSEIDNKSASQYLLNFSFGRPRDVINYLNIIKDNNFRENAFIPSLFRANKISYSNKFYTELRNELSIHHNIGFVDDCLNLLGDMKKIYFSYNEIKSFYEANISRYPNIKDIKSCIDFLYKFSIIGNSWKEPIHISRSRSRYKYKHAWAYRADGSLTPNYEHSFVIHNALQKHYSL